MWDVDTERELLVLLERSSLRMDQKNQISRFIRLLCEVPTSATEDYLKRRKRSVDLLKDRLLKLSEVDPLSPDPFWPYPREGEVAGRIDVGRVRPSCAPVGFELDELRMHGLVLGSTGSGKTTLLIALVDELTKVDKS